MKTTYKQIIIAAALVCVAVVAHAADDKKVKKQKEIRKFQNALAEGTKVVTGGGVYGTVKRVNLEANTVDVEIARGVVITVAKGYVFADAASQTPNA